MRALFAAVTAALLLAARCDNPVVASPDSLDPRCHSEPGWYWCGDGDPGCCFQGDRCAYGECRYDGPQTPVPRFGASRDGGERQSHSARRFVP